MAIGHSWLAGVLLAAAAVPAAPALAQEPAQAARGEAFVQLPFWPGYWVGADQAGTPISGIGRPQNGEPPPPAVNDVLAIWGNAAPWNEEGRRRVAEALRTMGSRKGLGWGYPLMMTAPTPFQVLITPEEVLIINAYNEARHVYTDGRDHPPADDLWPTATGNSVGHWEGQTLVIDTIMVSNPNDFFQGAPPLSEQAHYVERIWLEGDTLHAEMTIEDPVTLSGPWKARLSWVRDQGFDRMVQVDWNNDRTVIDDDGNTIAPPANEEEGQ